MTKEELLNEMYEVCAFLMRKHEELEVRYGDFPTFEDDAEGRCQWAYRVLESLCGSKAINCAKEYDGLSGYMKATAEHRYRPGDGVRKAMMEQERL